MIDALKSLAARELARHRAAAASTSAERAGLVDAEAALASAEAARTVLQDVAQAVQTAAHEQVARVVSHCLQTVFPDAGYSFRVRFDRKRGKTEAAMSFVKHGCEIDPTTEDSGGAVGVAAMALRLSALMLSTPRRRRLLVLDEPFTHLSARHVPTIASLVETLAVDLGIQFVIVTHNDMLKIGTVVEVGR